MPLREKLGLFGVGELLTDCYSQLVAQLGREPDFLCDNASEKWGKRFLGLSCISPEELRARKDDTTVIITVRQFEPIQRQLQEMGFEGIQVACYDRAYDHVRAIKQLNVDASPKIQATECVLSVRGKWALVTGASRGIGRQIALAMAGLGANLVLHGRAREHILEVAKACTALGVEIVSVGANFSQLSEVEKMLSGLLSTGPPIDILFNNAAIAPFSGGGFWKISPQEFADTYQVNSIVPMRICQALIPSMLQRGFGRIVNVSSTIQRRPADMAYACSKAALNKFVHDLTPSLQGTGVMLSLLNPGWLQTDMGGADAPQTPESVIPGALLGVILDRDVSGRWFGAQDYAGMSLEDAVHRADFYMY